MTNPNIILVEDDANVSLMLTRQLTRAGSKVSCAGTVGAARELVRDEPWDLIILDRTLPDGDGIDLCRELRAADEHAYIIMLTAASSDAEKLEGFACGADDYITKPAQMDELMARIRAGLRIVGLQKQLLELSQTDPLTSLRNRRAFDERLGDAFAHAMRYERPLSLAVVDVDHFKSINDGFGHDAGDAVLRGVAKILGERTRQSDFVARVGGEEFAVLLPETALFEALQFGEKLRSSIAAESIAGHEVRVSIGVASFPHSQVPSEADLFRAADQALYRAKMNGRNRVEIERRRTCRQDNVGRASARPAEASAS
ncbi:MAG TPA: diguanylate cyclase [Thermoanaerobaculia bacterium]|nr:diguanylate cyclase [Thermoanaerobaculia bacterium]